MNAKLPRDVTIKKSVDIARYERQKQNIGKSQFLVVFLWDGNGWWRSRLVDRRNAQLQLSQASGEVGPRNLMRQRPAAQIQCSVESRVWRIVHGAWCRSGCRGCAFAGEELLDTDTFHLLWSPESGDFRLDVRVLFVCRNFYSRALLRLIEIAAFRRSEIAAGIARRIRNWEFLKFSTL